MKKLTKRQADILDFIRKYLRSNGFPPSRPEIAKGLGLPNVSVIDWHLGALDRKGWISVRPETPRAIRLLRDDVPVVPAGPIGPEQPILDDDRIVRQMPRLVAEEFEPLPDFFLEVQDDSMDRAGIWPGDLLAVQAGSEGATGEVVVVRSGDEILIRRFRRAAAMEEVHQEHVVLLPESSDPEHRQLQIKPMLSGIRIEGVVVGGLMKRGSGS